MSYGTISQELLPKLQENDNSFISGYVRKYNLVQFLNEEGLRLLEIDNSFFPVHVKTVFLFYLLKIIFSLSSSSSIILSLPDKTLQILMRNPDYNLAGIFW